MIKIYCYSRCTTCKKALKWLDENEIEHEVIDIKADHPNEGTLRKYYAMSGLPLKRFFNTSGIPYREMGLSAATVMVPILIVLCPSFAGETGAYQATAIALASDIQPAPLLNSSSYPVSFTESTFQVHTPAAIPFSLLYLRAVSHIRKESFLYSSIRYVFPDGHTSVRSLQILRLQLP